MVVDVSGIVAVDVVAQEVDLVGFGIPYDGVGVALGGVKAVAVEVDEVVVGVVAAEGDLVLLTGTVGDEHL